MTPLQVGPMQYSIQRIFAASAQRPILNAACKEDPAGLGRLADATNVDVVSYDAHNGIDLTELPNFVQASVFDLPFEDGHFGSCVLGEFLEHCPRQAALDALREIGRVVRPGGTVLLTIPHDERPKEEQYDRPEEYETFERGVTSWHQSVWTVTELNKLFLETDWDCTGFLPTQYGGLYPGLAVWLRRPA